MAADFSRIARAYRWMEYLSFGPLLERCRFHQLPKLRNRRRALILGDGDGRFLARLLAENREMQADAVDSSPGMLALLAKRVQHMQAADRVQLHRKDALNFTPRGEYDLIVTHFFLDCLTTDEVAALTQNIRGAVSENALWVISDFAVPQNVARLPARILIGSLYFFFRLLTGLRTRYLPNHAAVLAGAGFHCIERKEWLAGILMSEAWLRSDGWLDHDDPAPIVTIA